MISMPPNKTLLTKLHDVSPYEGFDAVVNPYCVQTWGTDSPIFAELVEAVCPSLIVEVGTWHGGSAFKMAEAVRDLGLDCPILCVDTWLGALEFWTNHQDMRYHNLQLCHGYPQVYYQFLANVMHRGFQDIIVPFPQTSSIAARWLQAQGMSPDLVYIDGSHEEEDVYADLENYSRILSPGGMMFGDDYTEHWPGVKRAVDAFLLYHPYKAWMSDIDYERFWRIWRWTLP